MTAEQQWQEFDEKAEKMNLLYSGNHHGYGTASDYKKSREAYKSALRKAIEEEKGFEMNDAFDRGYKAALNFCLEKLETVEPPVTPE